MSVLPPDYAVGDDTWARERARGYYPNGQLRYERERILSQTRRVVVHPPRAPVAQPEAALPRETRYKERYGFWERVKTFGLLIGAFVWVGSWVSVGYYVAGWPGIGYGLAGLFLMTVLW